MLRPKNENLEGDSLTPSNFRLFKFAEKYITIYLEQLINIDIKMKGSEQALSDIAVFNKN